MVGVDLSRFSRHFFLLSSKALRSSFSLSRRRAAFSYSWPEIEADLSLTTFSISTSLSLNSGGVAEDCKARARTGLVDEVDGLIGQEALGNVAVGEFGGGAQRAVVVLDLVVRLVFVLEALEDREGLLDGGRVHDDRLEAALERGVSLDVLAVFIQRGRPDRLQLAARQRGLDHVGRVDRALGAPAPMTVCSSSMKRHDRAFGAADLLDDIFKPLFEFAAILGARDDQGQVESEKPFVQKNLRHIARRDLGRQAFNDGGLADAGVADEDGIIFWFGEPESESCARSHRRGR